MNEGTKTGIFWCVAVVMLAIAAFIAWPASTKQTDSEDLAGTFLFPKLTDPSVAASMKIVTFDEEQGQLETFEVRKDRETGLWTIPSRGGYPADAIDHMKDAANAFVGLKILDVQTSNAEDHDDLGVAEPKLEDLEVGDQGVGQLVTLKDESQQTLASLIIGDPTNDGKIYVRKPGQDPVYVVKLDESPLTTKFQSWIEEDLLKLSSIDIEDMEIKDYNAAINIRGEITMTRNYDVKVEMDGSEWKLDSLFEYNPENPLAPPTPVSVNEDEKLNATKLNAIKNALDDLKIADVKRKPDGISATLRANQDLLTDKEAVGSLAQRGFYPIQKGSQYDILSANGELTVGLKDGVRYILRFGNISGLTEEEDESDDGEEKTTGGVNRYLLVTTQVDDARFPPPDLQEVPKTIEDLKEILAAEKAAAEPKLQPPANNDPAPEKKVDADQPKASDDTPQPGTDTPKEAPKEAPEETPKETPEKSPEETGNETPAESTEKSAETEAKPTDEGTPKTDADPAGEPEAATTESGETEATGSGEGTGSGQGQQQQDAEQEAAEQEAASESKDAESKDEAAGDQSKPADTKETSDTAAESETAAEESKPEADQKKPAAEAEPAADASEADKSEPESADAKPQPDEETLTPEEMQERLEAEQEKITKQNQRKLDERKDKLDAARRRVRDLNERFADWYYVIPEDTYAKLRIKRDELFEQPAADTDAAPAGLDNSGPSFNLDNLNLPGAPGN